MNFNIGNVSLGRAVKIFHKVNKQKIP